MSRTLAPLLPVGFPAAPRVLELGDAALAEGLDADTQREPGATYDMVVVVGAAPDEAALDALAPDGFLVCVPRRGLSWPARRAFRKLGLAVEASYLAAPSARAPRIVGPARGSGTVRRVALRRVGRGRLRDLAERLTPRGKLPGGEVTGALGEGLGTLVADTILIAGRGGTPWWAPAVDALGEGEVDHWRVLAGHRADVMIGHGSDGPLGVLRVWREAEVGARLEGVLHRLHAQEAPEVSATIPALRWHGELAGRLVMAETFVHGEPLAPPAAGPNRAERMKRDLAAVRAWCQRRMEVAEVGTGDPDLAESLGAMLLRRSRRMDPGGAYLDALAELIARCDALQVPRGLLHNDLHGDNLLLQDGKVSGVLDWEHATTGPLWLDWSMASIRYALAARGLSNHQVADVRSLLAELATESSPLAEIIRSETQLLARATGASTDDLRALQQLGAFHVAYAGLNVVRSPEVGVYLWALAQGRALAPGLEP